MAIRGNIHIDTRVIEVADSKSEVKFELRFEVRIFNYPGIYVHIASNCHFHDF